jgi:glycosyltransferase involved in cell wall biosynthesis
MRVVSLAAGAAGMVCGSCLRDNRVAAVLRAQGRDITLIPLYTPLRTDEPSVAAGPVYYGGINVYLQQKYALFRHTPRFLDRLFDLPGLLRRVGKFATRTRAEDLGALTIAVLRGAHGPQRKELDRLVEMLSHRRPDLINLPNLMFAGIAPELAARTRAGLVCTLSGEDLFVEGLPPDARREALALIRQQAGAIDRFLATSDFYARRCVEFFGLPAERITVVPLGVPVDHAVRSDEPPAEPFVLAYVGRVAPEKGLHVAADAVVRLRRQGRAVRLVAAGWSGDATYLEAVRRQMANAGCGDAFAYRGEVSRADKYGLLGEAHAFSLPSVFPEAKGLPVLEALSVGVPVLQPRSGSFVELIEATGGGLLFEPGDGASFASAIARLIDDPPLRRSLGQSGAAAVRARFSDEHMAAATWRAYESVAPQATAR